MRRQKQWRSRAFIAMGALALLALGYLASRPDRTDGSGRVWSAEHGHWHDQ